MRVDTSRQQGRTLCDIEPGEVVRVRSIGLDSVRARCWDWGLRAGSVVLCRSRGPAGVVLQDDQDKQVRIGLHQAHFIQVGPAAGRWTRSHGAGRG